MGTDMIEEDSVFNYSISNKVENFMIKSINLYKTGGVEKQYSKTNTFVGDSNAFDELTRGMACHKNDVGSFSNTLNFTNISNDIIRKSESSHDVLMTNGWNTSRYIVLIKAIIVSRLGGTADTYMISGYTDHGEIVGYNGGINPEGIIIINNISKIKGTSIITSNGRVTNYYTESSDEIASNVSSGKNIYLGTPGNLLSSANANMTIMDDQDYHAGHHNGEINYDADRIINNIGSTIDGPKNGSVTNLHGPSVMGKLLNNSMQLEQQRILSDGYGMDSSSILKSSDIVEENLESNPFLRAIQNSQDDTALLLLSSSITPSFADIDKLQPGVLTDRGVINVVNAKTTMFSGASFSGGDYRTICAFKIYEYLNYYMKHYSIVEIGCSSTIIIDSRHIPVHNLTITNMTSQLGHPLSTIGNVFKDNFTKHVLNDISKDLSNNYILTVSVSLFGFCTIDLSIGGVNEANEQFVIPMYCTGIMNSMTYRDGNSFRENAEVAYELSTNAYNYTTDEPNEIIY